MLECVVVLISIIIIHKSALRYSAHNCIYLESSQNSVVLPLWCYYIEGPSPSELQDSFPNHIHTTLTLIDPIPPLQKSFSFNNLNRYPLFDTHIKTEGRERCCWLMETTHSLLCSYISWFLTFRSKAHHNTAYSLLLFFYTRSLNRLLAIPVHAVWMVHLFLCLPSG